MMWKQGAVSNTSAHYKGTAARVYFDGGCRGPIGHKEATSAWVAYDIDGV